ncbi:MULTISPECIES: hypothetical protein [Acetobacter]|uniref:Uncharacterized protein n=1 Tax=Acetobacter tropicalis TaxID=104102 RepID=A0A095B218_9PROT|nr:MULTISPECIES: hypothetical protein [Acetobacter]KGB23023.1 hypothetical protein AtDm6_1892 [Acetobacter tropicalis]
MTDMSGSSNRLALDVRDPTLVFCPVRRRAGHGGALIVLALPAT